MEKVFRGFNEVKLLSAKCIYSMNSKSIHCAVKWSLSEFHFYIQCFWIKIIDALICMLCLLLLLKVEFILTTLYTVGLFV